MSTTQPTYEHQRRNDAVLLNHYRQHPTSWYRLVRDTPADDRPWLERRLRNAGASEDEVADAMRGERR
jgi:hypothetical protein